MRPSFLVFLWPHFFQSLMTVSRLRERKKKCDKMFFLLLEEKRGRGTTGRISFGLFPQSAINLWTIRQRLHSSAGLVALTKTDLYRSRPISLSMKDYQTKELLFDHPHVALNHYLADYSQCLIQSAKLKIRSIVQRQREAGNLEGGFSSSGVLTQAGQKLFKNALFRLKGESAAQPST